MKMTIFKAIPARITSSQIFMLSVFVVNGGNYLYNLLLGRILGPKAFADAALMITLLLILSFLAMTFQLATAKFTVTLPENVNIDFRRRMYLYAIFIGLFLGLLLIVFSNQLQMLFQTDTTSMFVVFGFGVPLYFLLSVNRGFFQGRQEFVALSMTYQSEMWSRLLITLILLWLFTNSTAVIVSIGILCSLVMGLFPMDRKPKNKGILQRKMTKVEQKTISMFVLITAFYEMTQIVINNSDILLVKHYFSQLEAGLYASLALIGRVVYFVAWMFVMQLLPSVVQKQKDGEPHSGELFKYVGAVSILSFLIVVACALIPEFIISIMFGKQYLSMAHLLWMYAIATSLFAISNIFSYYFLSLDKYIPVILSGLMGLTQVVLIAMFHKNLEQVVHVQIIAMAILFILQLVFFQLNTDKKRFLFF
ncbi:oligosaccharide flippase family protein [Ascidiimonas sp. W6]|uniref:oligosaccharide flippase family protein n=1 Tax=Ascidiimonas meishanensis TaxID=3128903 RepID=UPI0030EBAD6F